MSIVVLGSGWCGQSVNAPWLYNAVPNSNGYVRWGTNQVAGYWPFSNPPHYEEFLYFTLDQDTQSECTILPKDSGGPSLIEVNGQLRTIGIHFSLDEQAPHPAGLGASGIDIRVSRYKQWIDSVLNGDDGGDFVNLSRSICQ